MKDKDNFDIVIGPNSGWFDFSIREIFRFWDLIYLFVRRDFVAYYSQTILGPLWYLISPLASTAVFVVTFGKIANIPTDNTPHVLFYLSGLILWNYFVACLIRTSDVLVTNVGIIGKVYFPRITIPISTIISSLFSLMIQLMLLLVIYFYFYFSGFSIRPNAALFLLPVSICLIGTLAMGIGILFSSLTVKFRDLSHIVGLLTTLLMYVSPVVYPASRIPEKWLPLFFMNPIAPLIEMFRYGLYSNGQAPWNWYLVSCVSICSIFFVGFLVFNRIEKTFVDTV